MVHSSDNGEVCCVGSWLAMRQVHCPLDVSVQPNFNPKPSPLFRRVSTKRKRTPHTSPKPLHISQSLSFSLHPYSCTFPHLAALRFISFPFLTFQAQASLLRLPFYNEFRYYALGASGNTHPALTPDLAAPKSIPL